MSAALDERAPLQLHTSQPPSADNPHYETFAQHPHYSSAQRTPTQATFDAAAAAAASSQQNKRNTPPTAAPEPSSINRRPLHRATRSLDSNVHMDDDDDNDDDDALQGSDNESVTSDSRPSKKKKGQRFYCTDYPPCNLSFTRSEHLARHIRKHTGERPFQCHCLRRFSRLDNLRQHAQTVHVNEDIPGDSLAATGTRFQRQIRTDRVRASGHRPRTSTLSSGGHSRGHSRNISNSSIGSISDIGSPDDGRRRPPPLAMAHATSPRPGLSVDTWNASTAHPEAPYGHYLQYSPSGYSTPMSVFSNDANSPMAPSGLQSPISFMPRSQGSWDLKPHQRRLSVPSQPNPFHQQVHMGAGPGPQYMSPMPPSPAAFSPTGSILNSPTASSFGESRQDAPGSPESYWKRRTWHPGTYTGARPATSGLSYYQTPDAPQPVAATQPAAQQSIRLPGIDSFDRAHVQPIAPIRRPPSTMEIDDPARQAALSESHRGQTDSDMSSKRTSWGSMNQNLGQLDITKTSPSSESTMQWGAPSQQPLGARPVTAPYGFTRGPHPVAAGQVAGVDSPSVPDQSANQQGRVRHGWYNGPLPGAPDTNTATVRTSPDVGSSSSDGVPTPSSNSISEYNPAIRHSNGYIEAGPPGAVVEDLSKPPVEHPQNFHRTTASSSESQQTPRSTAGMDRLDALVAVATREDQSTKQ